MGVEEVGDGARTAETEVGRATETFEIGEMIDRLYHFVMTEEVEEGGREKTAFVEAGDLHLPKEDALRLMAHEILEMRLLRWRLTAHVENLVIFRCQAHLPPQTRCRSEDMVEDEGEGVEEVDSMTTIDQQVVVDHPNQYGIVALSHQLHHRLKCLHLVLRLL